MISATKNNGINLEHNADGTVMKVRSTRYYPIEITFGAGDDCKKAFFRRLDEGIECDPGPAIKKEARTQARAIIADHRKRAAKKQVPRKQTVERQLQARMF